MRQKSNIIFNKLKCITVLSAVDYLLFNYSFDIFRDKQRGQTTTVSKKRDNGLYDVSLFKTLSEEDLRPETVFGCVLTIPGTDYSIKEETMYFPGKGIYYFKMLTLYP